jgi:hypothetical protein
MGTSYGILRSLCSLRMTGMAIFARGSYIIRNSFPSPPIPFQPLIREPRLPACAAQARCLGFREGRGNNHPEFWEDISGTSHEEIR